MGSPNFQAEFFASMAEPQTFRLLFEHLPGIVFAKDAGGRMIAASGPIVERLGFSKERDRVGKTDGDLFPPEIAAAFRSDDQQVLRTGKPLVNRLEVWYDAQRVQGAAEALRGREARSRKSPSSTGSVTRAHSRSSSAEGRA